MVNNNVMKTLAVRGLCEYQTKSNRKTLSHSLNELLNDRNLCISQLAQLTGVSKQSLGDVFRGKTIPAVDVAIKIAYVLGVAVEDIFKLSEEAWIFPYLKMNQQVYWNIKTNGEILNEERKKLLTSDDYQKTDFIKLGIHKFPERM